MLYARPTCTGPRYLGLAVFIAQRLVVFMYILASDGEKKLRDAAERGDIGEVARLIESGVSVNAECREVSMYIHVHIYCTPCLLPSNPR